MKPNQELYELIKSLSKNEKTYFKKFATRHYSGDNTFIKLFNELERKNGNGAYSEEDIKKKFTGESFITQLAVTKNYLYNNILKSLNLYYTEDNIEIRLGAIINSAMILYRKELFAQSLKVIAKAKRLAEVHDKPSKLLEAIHIERQALRVNTPLNEAEQALLKNYDEEIEVLKKLKNISEYRRLYDTLVIYASAKGASKNEADSARLNRLLSNRLLKNYKLAEYFQSKIIFFLIHCFTNNLKGSYAESLKYGQKALDLIAESENNKTIAAYEYILFLQEAMHCSHALNQPERSGEYYNRLISEQDTLLRHAPDKVRNFLKMRTLTGKLNINISSGNFEGNIAVINELLALSKKNEKARYRDELIVTNFLAAITYFGLGRLDEALLYLNKIFNSKDFELREDILVICRVFNLIIHYELGHMGSLDYYIKSTYRYLKQKNRLKGFEKLVLNFLQKTQSAANEKELFRLLRKTKKELAALTEARDGITNIIDLNAWIESKLQRRSYLEIIKENYRNSLK